MNIISLETENVKRVKAVTIKPNGNMVVIGGQNGAGKSSILDSIEYALGGTKHICSTPLHAGADRGHIILETDMYTVKRTFTPKDTYIEVKTKEGYKITTPQELLNKLVGDLSFDPLEFTRMKPAAQVETLKNLLGLDFSELDKQYKQIEENRRDVGRDVKQAKAMYDGVTVAEDVPDTEVVVSELMKTLEESRITNTTNQNIRNNAVTHVQWVSELTMNVKDLEQRLESARQQLAEMTEKSKAINDKAKACIDIPTEPITRQIQEAESVNAQVRAKKSKASYGASYQKLNASWQSMTLKLKEIECKKADMISDAKFPIDGITFGDSGVLVNGLPFEQASSAEQLKIAVAMGLSSNPDLRIVLIRDGSLLDESSLAAIADMAEQYEAQVWMERVGDGAEVSVVIQDGKILENRIPVQETEEVA